MQYLSSNPSNISFVFRFKYKVNDTFNLLLLSDLHLDNPKTDRKILKRLLDEAKEKQAIVLINGDLFCVMQSKDDERHSKQSVMAEHNETSYFNDVVNDVYNFLLPYKDIIAYSGNGNHETKIKKVKEVDLMLWLTDLLQKSGSKIIKGDYRGYLNFVFEHESGGNVKKYCIYHFHGAGGGGKSTKGVNQFQSLMLDIQDVDAIWMGHVHEFSHHINVIECLNQKFETISKEVDCIRTPTFKEEFLGLGSGWHVERAGGGKPIGGAWVELELKSNEIKRKIYRAI
jgi:predicted phosphodiesterase